MRITFEQKSECNTMCDIVVIRINNDFWPTRENKAVNIALIVFVT